MELKVRFEKEALDIAPPEELTIGRQADLVVDSMNRRLHRVLLHLRWDRGWTVANVGRSIAVVAADLDGSSYARLVPGAAMPIPFANTSLAFSAGSANYRVTAHLAEPTPLDDRYIVEDGLTIEQTESPALLDFNDEQLELLAVLAAPRLDGPITVADLPGSREVALQLGWSTSKLNRKLDRLCAKLDRGGLQGVSGASGNNASERRLVLANFAVESGLVTS